MFVIMGATGNVGSSAVQALREAGAKVRAVVRNPEKAQALAATGAEVFVADISDQAALRRAVAGAEGVFFLSPPDLGASDFIADRKRLTDVQVKTLSEARVPHVVFLSSLGAQHPSGTGPIVSTYNAEQQLRAAGLARSFVRAAYFVENWAAVLHPVKNDGVLPTFLPVDLVYPMVATADIGPVVARTLLDGPRGERVIELAGPKDASSSDVAAAFGRILQKPVQAVAAPLDATVPTLTSFGISQNIAELFQEMYAGLMTGRVAPEAELTRGTTPLDVTLRQLLG